MASIIDKAKSVLHHGTDTVTIGGHKVGSTGYGLMGLTWRAEPPPREQAFEAMKAALDGGANLWNGGEFYGPPERNSLHILAEYFEKNPKDAEKVVICIKGGAVPGGAGPDASPANTRRSVDECLKIMGPHKKLDMFECARVDPKVPVEIPMRVLNEYVQAGKLGGVCLSECSADTIRRAAKEVKIAAVELEFSLWETDILTNGIADTCAELGIPIVAYSPLGRGFLTGQIKKPEDIPETDFRRTIPRFQGDNFYKNLDLVHEIEKVASKKGCTSGQVAIAWVKAQSKKPGRPLFIPIPGATKAERVKENLVNVHLSDEELKEIDSILAGASVVGNRYDDHLHKLSYGDSPPLETYKA